METALGEFLLGIRFQHPAWLWTWPIALLALGWLQRRRCLEALARVPGRPGGRRYRHPRIDILRRLQGEQVRRSQVQGAVWRGLHYVVLLLCVHLALAQPYRLGPQLPSPPEYRDTIFIMDTSVSLVLRDYLVDGERVDRMTILKAVLEHFIDQLDGNRIGVTVFSERPYTLLPLTDDYALLKTMVRRLRPAVLTGRTSDLGTGLVYTLQQLREMEQPDPAHRPALVLLTDANRSYRETDPRDVATLLREQGYRLHTIGIGAASRDAAEEGAWGLLYQPANYELLRAIAAQGGGRFYRADDAAGLRAAVADIQSAERRQVEVTPRHVAIPLYQWPMLAGLLWMVSLQLHDARRRQS